VANDLRDGAATGDRVCVRRKPTALSLGCIVDLLFALSGRDRLSTDLSASLLAVAANDCGQAASDLAHYAAWRGRVGMGDRRRKIFPLVASWRMLCPRGRVADFPKNEDAGVTSQTLWAGGLFTANMNFAGNKNVSSRCLANIILLKSRLVAEQNVAKMRLLAPMWRNGRRNGLKIRWAVKGPCRFESGHRHSDCGFRMVESGKAD
jgi:hypothetical protein